jgi:hypothetical protein
MTMNLRAVTPPVIFIPHIVQRRMVSGPIFLKGQ